MKTFEITNNHGTAAINIDDRDNDVLAIVMDWNVLWNSERRDRKNIAEVIFKNIYVSRSDKRIPVQARIICFPDSKKDERKPKIEFEHQIRANADFFLDELNYVIPVLNKFKNEIFDRASFSITTPQKMKKGKANAEKK